MDSFYDKHKQPMFDFESSNKSLTNFLPSFNFHTIGFTALIVQQTHKIFTIILLAWMFECIYLFIYLFTLFIQNYMQKIYKRKT